MLRVASVDAMSVQLKDLMTEELSGCDWDEEQRWLCYVSRIKILSGLVLMQVCIKHLSSGRQVPANVFLSIEKKYCWIFFCTLGMCFEIPIFFLSL